MRRLTAVTIIFCFGSEFIYFALLNNKLTALMCAAAVIMGLLMLLPEARSLFKGHKQREPIDIFRTKQGGYAKVSYTDSSGRAVPRSRRARAHIDYYDEKGLLTGSAERSCGIFGPVRAGLKTGEIFRDTDSVIRSIETRLSRFDSRYRSRELDKVLEDCRPHPEYLIIRKHFTD